MELLKAALSALPTAASSPYAFVAYLAVLIVWTVIAWRVKRNNQLLRHLKDLPAKNRLDALQMEMGSIRIKGALSPEQWLKARTHFYYLIGFLALCFLILIIFTVSIVTARSIGTVVVDITALEKEPSEGPSANLEMDSNEVKYVYERKNNKLLVEPVLDNPAFLSPDLPIANGDRLRKVSFPVLSIQVVNNSNQTTLLTEAVLEVISSKINKEPILSVWERVGEFEVQNQGWGKVVNPSINLGVTEQGFCGDVNSWKDESNRVSLETFYENRAVPVMDFMPPELSKERSVCVFGHLSYATEDGDKRNRKFKVIVVLPRPHMFDEYGDVNFVTHVYDVFLDAGKSGYIKRLGLSQKIEPGRTDHFVIKISSDKSAHYGINLKLKSADGAIVASQDIDLGILLPRGAIVHSVERGP